MSSIFFSFNYTYISVYLRIYLRCNSHKATLNTRSSGDFTVKEDEGRTLWLDTQSHASSSASSADDDYSWQWPTSFWSQFKVSTNVCSNYRIQCHFTHLSVLYRHDLYLTHCFEFEDKRWKLINILLLLLNNKQYKNMY